MFNLSGNFITIAITLFALIIVIWGYNRAKPFGEIGILAWLQSLTLITPWLVFFGLLATGIYINLISVILLLVLSSAIYIYLGNVIRKKATNNINTENLEEIKKQLIENFNKNQSLNDNNQSLSDDNSSDNVKKNQFPVTIEQIQPNFTPINEEDLNIIKTLFGIDTFFITQTISYQEGVIFKGNLRGEADVTHQNLTEKLIAKLGDKYRLFLVETPEGKPVVIILPSTNDPKPLTLAQKNVVLVLFLATIFTSMEAIALLLGFDLVGNWSRYQEVLPLCVGLWIILLSHEMGHQIIGARNNVKISLPFFLPSLQIGSFGAITRFESIIPNRSVLFDVSFAGPVAGFCTSFVILLLGFATSNDASSFQIPTNFFQGSIFVGILAKLFFNSALQNETLGINPLMILGWLGLVINALNLLPAGQLDGGRIIQAIYGRKTCRRATIGTLIILGVVSILNPINSLPFYWAIVILFLQRELERPSLNEITEPNDKRAAWGLILIFLSLITLIPITPSLANSLGIGF